MDFALERLHVECSNKSMSKTPIFTSQARHNSDAPSVTTLTRYVVPNSARLLAMITLIVLLEGSAGAADAYEENPGVEGDGKVTIGPDYQIDPDLKERGNPSGKS